MNSRRNKYQSRAMKLFHVFVVIGILAYGSSVVAFVSDKVANEYRYLVNITADQQKCPDPDKLSLYFGRYGFYHLLSPVHINKIESGFDVFAPILVDAQRPGNRLHPHIQSFYRTHADAEQRYHMIEVLREWLTADLVKLSTGSRIVWPPEAVEQEKNTSRIIAAEMLFEWGDHEAIPLVHSLRDSVANDEDMLWLVERLEMNFKETCYRTFLYVDSEKELRNCKQQTSISGAAVKDATCKDDDPMYRLDDGVLLEFWDLLSYSVAIENTQWSGGWHVVQLVFDDGVIATLCPESSDNGIIIYKDNTSIRSFRKITLQNEKLRLWLRAIINGELKE